MTQVITSGALIPEGHRPDGKCCPGIPLGWHQTSTDGPITRESSLHLVRAIPPKKETR